MKYIALLRGINVGGHKKILMADLRTLLSKSRQLKNIRTYIQSGNVVFESEKLDTSDLEDIIHTLILRKYAFDVPIQVYSKTRWGEIMKNNAYAKNSVIEINTLYATLLNKIPCNEDIAILEKIDFTPDTYIIKENIIYSKYWSGVGRSKMTSIIFEKKLKVLSTSRNWKTMTKIAELLSN